MQSDAAQVKYDAELEIIMAENEKDNALVAAKRDKAREEYWVRMEKEILDMRLEKEIEEEENRKLTEKEILAHMVRIYEEILKNDCIL